LRGIVRRLNAEHGYGFIEANGEEFFFHRNALQGVDWEEIAVGTALEFEVDKHPEGDRPTEHPRAVNVRLADDAFPAADHEPLPPRKLGLTRRRR
jgi:cold shock CspA family protein